MTLRTRITIRSRLPRVSADIRQGVPIIVANHARLWEALSKYFAPVDTGFLMNSIEAEPSSMPSRWFIRVYADYGAHVEFGTRFQAAQPYLRPPMAQVESSFYRELADLVRSVSK